MEWWGCVCLIACVCFVDDGGLEMMARVYTPGLLGGMSGNYYPMVYSAYVTGPSGQVTAITQQPHGVASPESGEWRGVGLCVFVWVCQAWRCVMLSVLLAGLLEIMFHRRTNYFCCGLDNPLNDTTVLHDRVFYNFDSPSTAASVKQQLITALNE